MDRHERHHDIQLAVNAAKRELYLLLTPHIADDTARRDIINRLFPWLREHGWRPRLSVARDWLNPRTAPPLPDERVREHAAQARAAIHATSEGNGQ